jgi:hypothetical protein
MNLEPATGMTPHGHVAVAVSSVGAARRVCALDASSDLDALSRACSSLWLATLSLMTAFMQNTAPAHRLLLARRIARNFATLREQECFSAECRASFSRLALRWQDRAERLDCGDERPHAGIRLLRKLLTR